MKRAAYFLGAAILLLFLGITVRKITSPGQTASSESAGISPAEKRKVEAFWQVYREATTERIAGRIAAAAQKYEQALSLNKVHENTLYYLGNMYFELREFDKAERLWEELLTVNATNARAHLQLGNLYLRFDSAAFFDLDKAELAFKQALAINKEETGASLRLGETALLQGDLPLAQSYLENVIGSNSQSVEAYFLRGYLAWKRGEPAEATAFLRQARKHSAPMKSATGVPGEGDTKSGKVFHVSVEVSPFASFIMELAALDEATLQDQTDPKYQAVDAFLSRIARGENL